MNNRQRKKWLKQQGLYVSPKETWNLDITFAKYIIPRLKKFKKLNNGYPGREEMDTPEKWDKALDKMIQAFEYVVNEFDWWTNNSKYGCLDTESKYDDKYVAKINKSYFDEEKRRQVVINEGLQLFAKYYIDLWW